MLYKVRGRTFDEFVIGEEIVTGARTVTEADVVNFACLSGDFHPEHMNVEYAKKGPLGERIAHGLLVVSIATGLLNQTGSFEGTTIAVLEMGVRFRRAVKFGDTIRAVQKIVNKRETSKPDRGILTSLVTVFNQDDQTILEADLVVMLFRKDFTQNIR
jgi:acyl dehydratase